MKSFSEQDRQSIRKHLVHWFNENQRDLPWRKTYDPYQVWISEIMLQQTQVKTALPYYDRWMTAFPTIASVAKASEDEVLKLWEGLGYYSRVRNLQKAAQVIMDKHQGKIPTRFEELLELPGIGRYSAGAVSSIAFNQEKPVVDGNVIRVLARLIGTTENTRLPKNVEQFWNWAEALIPTGHAREFNQGMMELGALVCTPANPKCGTCPLAKQCVAYAKGIQEQLPNRGESEAKIKIQVSVAVIRKGDKVFIQKRPSHGLMAGLWEFPGGKTNAGETSLKAIHREIREELGVGLKNVKKIRTIKHGYTKFHVDLHCFTAELGEGTFKPTVAEEYKWVSMDSLKKYPFSAPGRKLIDGLTG
ncbi:A/G-specific adenine glycosylase [Candidatus Peregrinibacteria bacterium]|nr:A/G-specific adenine glycosylase [Candidatus Peregrinibacteria bacterium]